MTGAVVLHDYWRSSASYRVRIALALKGISYRRVSVDLVAGDHRAPSYLAVNPQGLVPALHIDDQVLTQSLAIVEYLEETRPAPALLPEDAAGRVYVRALALAVACEVHPVSNLSVLNRIDRLAGHDVRAEWNRNNIADGLAKLEDMLDHPCFTGEFCHGSTPGLADCTVIPQLYNATRWGVPFSHMPRLVAVHHACAGHAAFDAAHPDRFDPSQHTKAFQGERE